MKIQQIMLLDRKSRLDFLATLKIPTLLMVGEKAIHFYSSTVLIAKLIKDSTLRIIANTGHMLTLESPDIISNFLIEWLESIKDPKGK